MRGKSLRSPSPRRICPGTPVYSKLAGSIRIVGAPAANGSGKNCTSVESAWMRRRSYERRPEARAAGMGPFARPATTATPVNTMSKRSSMTSMRGGAMIADA